MPDPDFEAEFKAGIEAWRQSHGVRDGDGVLLLVDLFRIHQKHWDEIRRRQPPGCEDLRSTIAQVTEIVAVFQKEATDLSQELLQSREQTKAQELKRWAAAAGVLVGAFGGYVLGRLWP